MTKTKTTLWILLALGAAVLVIALESWAHSDTERPAAIPHLPPRVMPIPADNQPNLARQQRGYDLSHSPDLSVNGSLTCFDCHDPGHGLSDKRQFSLGRKSVDGTRPLGNRHAIGLTNTAFHLVKFHDGLEVRGLEAQAWDAPQNPIEQGPQRPEDAAKRFLLEPSWVKAFNECGFAVTGNVEDPNNVALAVKAIAACLAQYQRTLIATDTNLDRYQNGETWYMSAEEKRGAEHFYSPRFACGTCHADRDGTDDRGHNVGVEFASRRGNLGGNPDIGMGAAVIGLRQTNQADNFKFVTPRFIDWVSTAPYMHNGTFPDLPTCVDYFIAGGFIHSSGNPVTFAEVQSAFDTKGNYHQPADWVRSATIDPLIQPIRCTAEERKDLLTFITVSTTPRDRPTGERPTQAKK